MGRTRRMVGRAMLATALVVAVGMTGLPATSADTAAPVNQQSFLLSQATVATAEAAAPVHSQFTVACPVPGASPSWLADPGNPGCPSGQMKITVSPGTKYYVQQCTSTGCSYPAGTYETAIVAGGTVRVGGQWTRIGYSSYEFDATYVWAPGTGVTDPPPNPKPAAPCPTAVTTACLQDYNFSRRFVVDATVRQTGDRLVPGTVWSDKWGFVVGAVTDYFQNNHAQAIAAAHRDPVTLDPQLSIATVDVSTTDGSVTNQGVTRFWVQQYRLDCACYQWVPSTKADTVIAGQALRAAGDYGWTADGDWAFIARYVWRPAPQVATGRLLFNVDSPWAGMATDGRTHYSGSAVTGDGQANPSTVTFDVAWAQDPSSGIWTATGSWTAARTTAPVGTISGSLTATWDPSSSALAGSVVLEAGDGVFCGVTGGGTISGTDIADPLHPPVRAIDGALNIAVSRQAC
jgi:hypothetical protein